MMFENAKLGKKIDLSKKSTFRNPPHKRPPTIYHPHIILI